MRGFRSSNRLGPGAGLVVAALVGLALATMSATGLAGQSKTPEASDGRPPGAQAQAGSLVGDETCVTCHEEQGKGFGKTLHARSRDPRTPAAAQGCETCHGPGQAHVDAADEQKASTIRSFKRISPRQASETCLTCHTRGTHAQWEGSPHDARNLSCVTCHSVHEPKSAKAQLKTVTQIETCATCHRVQTMKIQRAAHMPVREGKMECSSCHNPHGSTNVKQLRVGNWVNESCVSCHTEKRGPFLFEHAAGRESCVTCHDPHGSSNDRMLVAKVPMLCQRCHIGTRHPSTIYDAKSITPPKPGQTDVRSNRLYGRGCVNCHSNIHGSNHPSGNAFLR